MGQPDAESKGDDDEHEWNEPQEIQDPERAMCDDVNGLSLSVHRRSYMGISSVHAVFRTMFRLRPSLQTELEGCMMSFEGTGQDPSNPWACMSPSDVELQNATPSVDEAASIDAYFAHIHGIVPLLDEAEFRETWRRGTRHDRPWCALLNIVLVLGSLLVGDSDESSRIYYERAKTYFHFELLGVGCVDSLQALCLLGGLYLHYKNAPNMAYAVMGVAYRMAIGLGLHRQQATFAAATGAHVQAGAARSQIRRRIWWSLFCLDTWGSMTLGRPTLGRWDPDTMDVPVATDVDKTDPLALALDSAREFCAIATRVQHRFAQLSPITTDEIAAHDAAVQTWYHSLPAALTDLDKCPERLVSAQFIMRNRYFNLRLLLYRSVLLRYANANVLLDSLPAKEQDAIQSCRDVACEAIGQVVATSQSVNRVRAWSGVWYLYQASMALLLSILVDREHPDSARWRASVENALLFFDGARPWLPSAARSSQVIRSLLGICTQVSAPAPAAVAANNDGAAAATEPDGEADMVGMGGADPSAFFWDQLGLDMFTEQGRDWDLSNWQLEFGMDINWYGAPGI